MSSVLLIPGFGGNVLRHRWPTFTGFRDAWLEPTVLLASGLEILALDDAGEGPHVPFFPSLSAGTAIGLYYPTLLGALASAGYRIGVARTDWRKPMYTSVVGIANSIVSIAGDDDEPVRVVAHSRGGLLAQEVVRTLADRGQLSAVRQVVTLGTPWKGAYAPLPFFGGWPYTAGDSVLAWTAPGLLFVSQAFRSRLRFVCATMPGLYELLPDPAAAAAAGDATAGRLYDAGPWIASGVPLSDRHLTAARARWAADTGWPGGVRLDCVVGIAHGALMGPCDLTRLNSREGTPHLADGDGVVPVWSAQPPGRAGIALDLGHQELVTSPVALPVILGLLK